MAIADPTPVAWARSRHPRTRTWTQLLEEVSRTVLDPCIAALREQGNPFVGCLYAGLMLTPDGVRVLEFNARFGDPETQVVLPLLDESLLDILTACARGEVAAGVARARPGRSGGRCRRSGGISR